MSKPKTGRSKKDSDKPGATGPTFRMVAAQQFNEAENKPDLTVFGCVTNAYDGPTFRWLFLKLENNLLTLDTERYYLSNNELPRLLGALVFIVKSVEP